MESIDLKSCRACALCDSRKHVLAGEGNAHASILLIAQAPGELEDESGKMFMGPSGDVFWSIINAINASREDFYMTNLLKCRLPKNRRPKQTEIAACSKHLEQELNMVSPTVVSPLGYYACKYIFETRKIGRFDKSEYPSFIGKAFVCQDFIVIPLSHPTSLIHHPEYRSQAQINYYRAFRLEPCKWFSLCPVRALTQAGRIGYFWTDHYCLNKWQECERYKLEAGGIAHADNMLPDGSFIVAKSP
ncbi:MAG: uracil-DNA glycosylase [Candidatus Cloacimonetes bacterium]|jgi:DNA polymerase|nr:uracil-DNA glycosylase [Candidatus Cloacimonadota bacterium]MDD2507289.1 uracil-DNA glycosylase [Candidatus Cloacimonadota bacterium]MDD4147506.1 uracil-DNA glycosylase [Candidatus Cloacimonadota bacterium]MDD4560706.1 uracil-DNA glycosylase [Candidatus Cloacimonadota bacterium]